MVSVVEARAAVEAAQVELEQVIEQLARSEGEAWTAWVELQVREFVRDQAGVFASISEEGRRQLKRNLAEVTAQQREGLEAEIRGWVSASTDQLAQAANSHKWAGFYAHYSREVAAVLEGFGFTSNSDLNRWEWYSSHWHAEGENLHSSPQNPLDRDEFLSAIKRLRAANVALMTAAKEEEGRAALDAWSKLD